MKFTDGWVAFTALVTTIAALASFIIWEWPAAPAIAAVAWIITILADAAQV